MSVRSIVPRLLVMIALALLVASGAPSILTTNVFAGSSEGAHVDEDENGSTPDPEASADEDEDELLCSTQGGPGWEGSVDSGGGSDVTQDSTPEACCLACVANPDCTQWFFDFDLCSHNVPPGNTCTGEVVVVPNSGRIRCPA